MILGVIITYNPDMKRLEKNINSVIQQVNDILIIDNFSNNINEIEELCFEKKCSILKNNINKGIAEALNQGLKYANQKKYEYILTLDQDSISEKNMISNLKRGFQEDEKIAIVSPSIFDLNVNQIMSRSMSKDYQEIEWAITSGSLCKVKYLLNVNGFNSKLFIDCVDMEICLRLRENNYKILLSRLAVLYHEVGKMKIKNILGVKFNITNHSSARVYYIFRNNLYINHLYKNKTLKLKLVKRFIGILLFEDEKIKKIFEIKRAVFGYFEMKNLK